MEVINLPFNKFIGLEKSDQPEVGLLQLDDRPQYGNHLGTVHAAAQFALAEACSGEYLLVHFGELAAGYVPLVRRVEVKYKKPATGKIYAQAQVADEQSQNFLADLQTRGRAVITVAVNVLNSDRAVTMSATFEWFVQKMTEHS